MNYQKCLKGRVTLYIPKNGEEQENVNICCLNENKLYGCPYVQLDIGEGKLIAVLDRGVEICLMLGGIVVDLIGKDLRAAKLRVVKRVVITDFGNRTKRINTRALNEFVIDGISYKHCF